jgi:hypothetical protein
MDIWMFCNGRVQTIVRGMQLPFMLLGFLVTKTYCNGPFKMDARSKVNIESIGVLKSDSSSSLLCSLTDNVLVFDMSYLAFPHDWK